MSNRLDADQKTILNLFSDRKANFLIPDYQRPYAWTTTECQILWDDIFAFAFPNDDYSQFKSDSDEYYLGPIVTFSNENNIKEVIDGQQRLTTLMLLLRAFHTKYGKMKDSNSVKTKETIEKCIWRTDEFGNPDKNALKIDSEVATDNDKSEFLNILKTGEIPKKPSSKYAENYVFFQQQINIFLDSYPSFFSYLPARILNNCYLLSIEADSQDSALRIFSTLNDRGLPLSDSDIFKAQFYKHYSDQREKDDFINKWKDLEAQCNSIFHPSAGSPMDELFTRYMYFERAKQGIKGSTTDALRKFYEKNSYRLLKENQTFDNLIALADFWNDVENQNTDRFTNKILRKLSVLKYAPNNMWTYFTSVYFMQNKAADGFLEDEAFYKFLCKTIGFIWTYAITNPGVNALRTPIYPEMINIVNDRPITFTPFDATRVRNTFSNFDFNNNRPITKSMLAWWAYHNDEQQLIPFDTILQIEHIFSRGRQEKERKLRNLKNLESLGNKSLLERRINIRASDYRFEDKQKYYLGFKTQNNNEKQGTMIAELISLAKNKIDFTEVDIEERESLIINEFLSYLKQNQLLSD